MSESNTKDLILDSAENLFSDNGFSNTSLRAIMKAADVNIASVHYHFGSKAALVEAVLRRRVEPINARRIELLEQAEAASHDGSPPVADIVHAFLQPVREACLSSGEQRVIPRLMSRMIVETSDEEMRQVVASLFGKAASRFVAALSRALPDADPEVVFWRMHFMVGAMAFAIVLPSIHPGENGHAETISRIGKRIDQLEAFAVAGLQAPVVTHARKEDE